MQHIKHISQLFILTFSLLLAFASQSGTIIEYTIGDKHSAQTDVRMAFVSNGKVRTINSGGRVEPEAIFDSSTNQLTLLDHQKKSYTSVSESEINAVSDQVRGLLSDFLSSMDLENPLGGSESSNVEIKHTGIQKKVAGISCQLYVVQKAGQPQSEICIADSSRLNIAPGDYDTLHKMYSTGASIAKTVRKVMGDSLGPIPEFDVEEIDGLPIYVRSLDESGIELTLKSYKESDISDDYYVIPQGYSKINILSLMH